MENSYGFRIAIRSASEMTPLRDARLKNPNSNARLSTPPRPNGRGTTSRACVHTPSSDKKWFQGWFNVVQGRRVFVPPKDWCSEVTGVPLMELHSVFGQEGVVLFIGNVFCHPPPSPPTM